MVIEISNTSELPAEKMRMESAPSIETAKAWAEKIGRGVYWFAKNHTAYAVIA